MWPRGDMTLVIKVDGWWQAWIMDCEHFLLTSKLSDFLGKQKFRLFDINLNQFWNFLISQMFIHENFYSFFVVFMIQCEWFNNCHIFTCQNHHKSLPFDLEISCQKKTDAKTNNFVSLIFDAYWKMFTKQSPYNYCMSTTDTSNLHLLALVYNQRKLLSFHKTLLFKNRNSAKFSKLIRQNGKAQKGQKNFHDKTELGSSSVRRNLSIQWSHWQCRSLEESFNVTNQFSLSQAVSLHMFIFIPDATWIRLKDDWWISVCFIS